MRAANWASVVEFQSTPPRREVTGLRLSKFQMPQISIHTSPKGGDARAVCPTRCS